MKAHKPLTIEPSKCLTFDCPSVFEFVQTGRHNSRYDKRAKRSLDLTRVNRVATFTQYVDFAKWMLMDRENALRLVERHVRLVHGGPSYVQQHDSRGVLTGVTETLVMLRDPLRPLDEPRGWHLALIAQILALDFPSDRAPAKKRSK